MAKKFIDDSKHNAIVEKAWQNYQKANAKKTAKKAVKKSTKSTAKKGKK